MQTFRTQTEHQHSEGMTLMLEGWGFFLVDRTEGDFWVTLVFEGTGTETLFESLTESFEV